MAWTGCGARQSGPGRNPDEIQIIYRSHDYRITGTDTSDGRTRFTGSGEQIAGDIRQYEDMGVSYLVLDIARLSVDGNLEETLGAPGGFHDPGGGESLGFRMARPRSTPQGVGLASLTVWLSIITLLLMVEFILLQAVAVGITTVVYSLIPGLDAGGATEL